MTNEKLIFFYYYSRYFIIKNYFDRVANVISHLERISDSIFSRRDMFKHDGTQFTDPTRTVTLYAERDNEFNVSSVGKNRIDGSFSHLPKNGHVNEFGINTSNRNTILQATLLNSLDQFKYISCVRTDLSCFVFSLQSRIGMSYIYLNSMTTNRDRRSN